MCILSREFFYKSCFVTTQNVVTIPNIGMSLLYRYSIDTIKKIPIN